MDEEINCLLDDLLAGKDVLSQLLRNYEPSYVRSLIEAKTENIRRERAFTSIQSISEPASQEEASENVPVYTSTSCIPERFESVYIMIQCKPVFTVVQCKPVYICANVDLRSSEPELPLIKWINRVRLKLL
jgi:hypothetical protein